jgi:hypothetical protein
MKLNNKVKGAFFYWWRFAIRGAFAKASFYGTLLFSLATFTGPNLGHGEILNKAGTLLARLAIGFGVAFLIHAAVAIRKARHRVDPFVLRVTDDQRAPGHVCNEKVCGYSIAVIVHNRSSEKLNDCIVYVVNAPSYDGSPHPRFVEKFDLGPRESKTSYVAYWFSRETQILDDKNIWISGPHGAFAETISRFPGPEAELDIKIESPDANSMHVRCRARIDEASRRLRAVHV